MGTRIYETFPLRAVAPQRGRHRAHPLRELPRRRPTTREALVTTIRRGPMLTTMTLIVLIASGCGAAPAPIQPVAAATAPIAGQTTAAQLATLPVKGRAAKTGYSRAQFGSGWADPDRNGCDARRDVLARQAVGTPERRGKAGCVFTADVLDPYTGAVIRSTDADIDHVVALGDAWEKGAQQITAAQREALANDPLNLLAVTASLNRSKGDSDAATWLPPNKDARCPYVATQVAVKAKYGLWVTQAERDAITRVLAACPQQVPPA